MCRPSCSRFFFFNDTATTEIYTLSLHDALPILQERRGAAAHAAGTKEVALVHKAQQVGHRSEEHTSELQSHLNLVCRLLLEKKKKITASSTCSMPGATELYNAHQISFS